MTGKVGRGWVGAGGRATGPDPGGNPVIAVGTGLVYQ